MSKLESIKNKIRALSAKTVANGCTEEEVYSAMRIIGKLLDEYNLSMDEVDLKGEAYSTTKINTGKKQKDAIYWCVSAIGKFTDCKVWLNRTNSGLEYSFFGQESDQLMAEYLFKLIQSAVKTELEKFKKTSVWLGAPSRRAATSSFEYGMGARLSKRLEDMTKERTAEVVRERGSTSLVVLKNTQLQAAFNDLNMKLRNTNSRQAIYNQNVMWAGSQAANNVNLNRPIPNSSSTLALS